MNDRDPSLHLNTAWIVVSETATTGTTACEIPNTQTSAIRAKELWAKIIILQILLIGCLKQDNKAMSAEISTANVPDSRIDLDTGIKIIAKREVTKSRYMVCIMLTTRWTSAKKYTNRGVI